MRSFKLRAAKASLSAGLALFYAFVHTYRPNNGRSDFVSFPSAKESRELQYLSTGLCIISNLSNITVIITS